MKNINSHFLIYILGVAIITISSCTNGYIKSGDKEYANYSYSKAISKYEKALKGQPDNLEVKLKLADSYRQINKSEMAEKYYGEIADSTGLPDESNLHFAQVLMKNNKYEEAKVYLQKYLAVHPNDELANDLLASTERIDELKEDTSAYILASLPLDNAVSMFGPSYYKDGVIYAAETEIISAASTNPWTGHSYLDMYFNKKDANGTWDVPTLFGEGKLNGKFHDGPATFNDDQTMIVYTRSAMKNDRKQLVNENNENNFYLYTSKFEDGNWTDPVEMPFNNINYSVGHPALSKDGNTLYFSSDMPGGYGGSDLYKSTYDGSKWSEPINLGQTINTNGNEVFPFVAKDGKLYFSSEGHQTMGGLDVYVAQQNSGIWTKPVNLAYPLNTSQDDFAFLLHENDTTGFVSSDREGLDMVYEFTKVPPVFILDGIAAKKADGLPMEGVTITLRNLTDNNEVTVNTSKDGKFRFNLLPQKEYEIIGEKADYFKQSEKFTTGTRATEKEVKFEFELDEIVTSESGSGSGNGEGDGANKTYDIGDIFYDYNEARIRPDAEPELNRLVKQLKDNPNITIEIQAHSDSRGSHGYNTDLSNRRAQSVVNYLSKKGIKTERIKSKGFGETRLVNNCKDDVECTEAQHQENRRTEFIVLSK